MEEPIVRDLQRLLEAVMINAALTALESLQEQGYYLHDASGEAADRDTFIRIVTTALQAALKPPAPDIKTCPDCGERWISNMRAHRHSHRDI